MPQTPRRRTVLKGIGSIGIAGLLAGCGGGGGGGGTQIGMVYATGGLGDGSFNDQAQQGVIDAEEEFDISYKESQPEEVSDFEPAQRQYAQSGDYDLVSCIGFLQTDPLSKVAPDFPDQNFMLVDSVVDEDNVANYIFAEHEGSFLVGLLAGKLTTMDFSAGAGATDPDKTTVGFVGGVESDLIKRFEAGFIKGAKYANEDVDVITSYAGSFSEPGTGQEQALSMYNSGADIVYHAAGNTGRGVFQAAQEKGKFAIGVDRDQSLTLDNFADVILASMVKRVDTAVYTAVKNVVNDNFQGGSINELGLADNGVEAIYGDTLGPEIPQDVTDDVSSARQSIIDGDITVPTSPK